MGSLHNIDFGVFWASWGGSGNGFREPKVVPFDGFRQVPGSEGVRGFDVPTGSGY